MKVGLLPAAGLARRLRIDTPKELQPFRGKAIIDYNVANLIAAGIERTVVVIRDGKESIRDHLNASFAGHTFEFVYQQGEIGNLLDAIKASYAALQGHTVFFGMADTLVNPNPFSDTTASELTLVCFRAAGAAWRHFGVLDIEARRVVDKPAKFVGDTCWGAMIWTPRFTERLMQHDNLTAAINAAAWDYRLAIAEYVDIGLGQPQPDRQDKNAAR